MEDSFEHPKSYLDCNQNWAGIMHKVQVDMCVQPRFKPICAKCAVSSEPCFPTEKVLYSWLPIKYPSKTLIRLLGCAGWSESLICAHANLFLLLDTGSNHIVARESKPCNSDFLT